MARKDMRLTPNEDVIKTSRAVGIKLRKSIDEAVSGGERTPSGAKTSRKGSVLAKRARGERYAELRRKRKRPRRVRVRDLELTEELAEAFYAVASGLAEGRTVVVGTAEEDLTTTQAAAELGMSRPTLINLLQAGELDYHMVGSHKRIPRSEVLRYSKTREAKVPVRDEEREAALRRMAEISNEAGEGY